MFKTIFKNLYLLTYTAQHLLDQHSLPRTNFIMKYQQLSINPAIRSSAQCIYTSISSLDPDVNSYSTNTFFLDLILEFTTTLVNPPHDLLTLTDWLFTISQLLLALEISIAPPSYHTLRTCIEADLSSLNNYFLCSLQRPTPVLRTSQSANHPLPRLKQTAPSPYSAPIPQTYTMPLTNSPPPQPKYLPYRKDNPSDRNISSKPRTLKTTCHTNLYPQTKSNPILITAKGDFNLIGLGSTSVIYQTSSQLKFTNIAVKYLNTPGLTNNSKKSLLKLDIVRNNPISPYLLELFEITFEPYPSLTMPLMDNGTLYDLIHNTGKSIPEPIQTKYAYQIASALVTLHKYEIIHGELKSNKIFLTNNGDLKVASYGLMVAKEEIKTRCSLTTVTGSSGGSYKYLSPELLTGEGIHTKASDMYAYATVVWELATQDEPWCGRKELQVFNLVTQLHRREPIPSDTNKVLSEIITQCWEDQPEKRLTAKEIIDRLTSDNDRFSDIALSDPYQRAKQYLRSCLISKKKILNEIKSLFENAKKLYKNSQKNPKRLNKINNYLKEINKVVSSDETDEISLAFKKTIDIFSESLFVKKLLGSAEALASDNQSKINAYSSKIINELLQRKLNSHDAMEYKLYIGQVPRYLLAPQGKKEFKRILAEALQKSADTTSIIPINTADSIENSHWIGLIVKPNSDSKRPKIEWYDACLSPNGNTDKPITLTPDNIERPISTHPYFKKHPYAQEIVKLIYATEIDGQAIDCEILISKDVQNTKIQRDPGWYVVENLDAAISHVLPLNDEATIRASHQDLLQDTDDDMSEQSGDESDNEIISLFEHLLTKMTIEQKKDFYEKNPQLRKSSKGKEEEEEEDEEEEKHQPSSTSALKIGLFSPSATRDGSKKRKQKGKSNTKNIKRRIT